MEHGVKLHSASRYLSRIAFIYFLLGTYSLRMLDIGAQFPNVGERLNYSLQRERGAALIFISCNHLQLQKTSDSISVLDRIAEICAARL